MSTLLAITIAGAALLAAVGARVGPAPHGPRTVGAGAVQPTFVGSREGCRRCHLREYRSWEKTPHARAFEALTAEQQADPACLSCHVTGFEVPGGFMSLAETPDLAGVGCEVCHGPGSEYRDREVMRSREASIAAGLRLPDESTCRGCHNEASPTFSGDFDYEAARERGVHEIRR